MLKTFLQFINESEDSNEKFINDLSMDLIKKIRSFTAESKEYHSFPKIKFKEPYSFDLILNLRKEKGANISQDKHFNKLDWEQQNYDDFGYSIDANIRTNSGDLFVPELEIHLILDPTKEPKLYHRLTARLIDILTHETNHSTQFSPNDRDPFSANPSTRANRNSSKRSYKYFLLPDEVESMVEGMYANSKFRKVPLDHVFSEYLSPLFNAKYLSKKEYDIVMYAWVKFAIERYPDSLFSSQVDHIINSL